MSDIELEQCEHPFDDTQDGWYWRRVGDTVWHGPFVTAAAAKADAEKQQ